MIKIKTLEVAGIGPAIHTMRNPYDSWEKSDTHHGLIACWRQIIENLPSGFIQRRTVMMSYAALRQICKQRKGHKLYEWHDFRHWAFGLPEGWMIGKDDE